MTSQHSEFAGQPAMSPRIQSAVSFFQQLRESGKVIASLPQSIALHSLEEGHAVQDAVRIAVGEKVRGWKAHIAEGHLARGAIVEGRCFESGSSINPSLMPFLGIEAEMAFFLDEDFPPRDSEYTLDEVVSRVSACAAIEILNPHFQVMEAMSWAERVADNFHNGGFVFGPKAPMWQTIDRRNAHVTLSIDGCAIAEVWGGHPANDPLLPLLQLINHFRDGRGMAAGEFVTTGSYTGLTLVHTGVRIHVAIDGIGEADTTFIE